jgi:tRNA-specific 2-thiouridylase
LTFDFSKEYKQEVVDYMISEYNLGRTPNPDVMCNRHVKFGSFLREALARGVDYVATGHYAQNIFDEKTRRFVLEESTDKNKDQSYFLWTLNQDDLKHVLFPVGHLKKDELRKIAEKNNIPVFDKKDSQGVCFIGHLDMKEFLKEYIKTEKGNVIDTNGEVIGVHEGAPLYTVGERHGFIVFNKGEKGTHGEPHFIISKDIAKNTLTVAPESAFKERSSEVAAREATLVNTSWVGDEPLFGKSYDARIRYRQERQKCTLHKDHEGKIKIKFDKHQKGMAEGQSAVIYDGNICLGGGILS